MSDNITFRDVQKLQEYMMDKPCVYESRPFGEFPVCYRVCGRVYVQFSPKEDWFNLTLKTNPEAASFYRQAYPAVVRGFRYGMLKSSENLTAANHLFDRYGYKKEEFERETFDIQEEFSMRKKL